MTKACFRLVAKGGIVTDMFEVISSQVSYDHESVGSIWRISSLVFRINIPDGSQNELYDTSGFTSPAVDNKSYQSLYISGLSRTMYITVIWDEITPPTVRIGTSYVQEDTVWEQTFIEDYRQDDIIMYIYAK